MTVQRVVILGQVGLENRPLAADLANSLVFPSSSWINTFGNPASRLCLGKSGWRCSGSSQASRAWIMDGDLGPYDALPVRLSMADTVLLLDFPLWLRLWRALRRGKENWDFWWWLITWRWVERPKLRDMLAEHRNAQVHILCSQKELDQLLSKLAPSC